MNEIVRIKFGSNLYGTSTPASDLDFKAIYLPEARDIVLGKYKKTIAKSRPKQECERNNKDDIDVEIFSLDRFLELLVEGQTVALDILFAPKDMQVSITPQGEEIMDYIYENREKLLTRNVNAFVGYARQQAAKYGIKGSRMHALKLVQETLQYLADTKGLHAKLATHSEEIQALTVNGADLISLEKTPLIEIVMLKGPQGLMDSPHLRVNGRSIPFHATVKYAKEIVSKMLEGYGQRAKKAHLEGGIDWKALSHAVRVNSEAMELLATNYITFPRPDKDVLLQIKTGQLPYEQVAEMIERGLADLYVAHEKSLLRDTPDYEFVDNLVAKVYSDIVKNS